MLKSKMKKYGKLYREARRRGKKFSIYAFKKKKLTADRRAWMAFLRDKKASAFYRKKRRWAMKLRRMLNLKLKSVRGRCLYPGTNRFEYYGGRGIKATISLNELELLYHKQNAAALKAPSVDRLNSDGNYEVGNVRFIELRDNLMKHRPRYSLKTSPAGNRWLDGKFQFVGIGA